MFNWCAELSVNPPTVVSEHAVIQRRQLNLYTTFSLSAGCRKPPFPPATNSTKTQRCHAPTNARSLSWQEKWKRPHRVLDGENKNNVEVWTFLWDDKGLCFHLCLPPSSEGCTSKTALKPPLYNTVIMRITLLSVSSTASKLCFCS